MQNRQRLHPILYLTALFIIWAAASACMPVQADDDADRPPQALLTMTSPVLPTLGTPTTATATATPTGTLSATPTGTLSVTPTIDLTLTPSTGTPYDDDDDDDDSTQEAVSATPSPSGTLAVTPSSTVSLTTTVTPTAGTGTPTPVTPTVTGGSGTIRIIVIEGPVSEININVITIYNFDITIDESNPVLQVIRIGDVLRIVGEWHDDEGDDDDDDGRTGIQLIMIEIDFINVDVVILDGLVWRDLGDCSGIPAVITRENALAYFTRCIDRPSNSGGGNSGGGNSGGGGSGSGGSGSGGGHDDDDDD